MYLQGGSHFHFKPTGPTGDPWLSWSYVTHNSHDILVATGQHVTLTLYSVALGVVFTVPLVAFARRSSLSRGLTLALCSALYAVPSLAFVVTTAGIFGLSRLTVVVPLAAYSLVVLSRNVLTGLDGVPEEVVDAARGMGFSELRILLRVRLPLAVPAMIAGLRLATVSTIELVVIGGYVGLGGFGDAIFQGLADNDYKTEITTYLILTVLLALVADRLFLLIQRLLTPWQRRTPAVTA